MSENGLVRISHAVHLPAHRLLVLQTVLALGAALELAGGLPQLFSARRFIAINGWPDQRVYQAVVQDAGVYILATSVFVFLLQAGAHLLQYGVTISGR